MKAIFCLLLAVNLSEARNLLHESPRPSPADDDYDYFKHRLNYPLSYEGQPNPPFLSLFQKVKDDCLNDNGFWRHGECIQRRNKKDDFEDDESEQDNNRNVKNRILRDMSKNGNVINIKKV